MLFFVTSMKQVDGPGGAVRFVGEDLRLAGQHLKAEGLPVHVLKPLLDLCFPADGRQPPADTSMPPAAGRLSSPPRLAFPRSPTSGRQASTVPATRHFPSVLPSPAASTRHRCPWRATAAPRPTCSPRSTGACRQPGCLRGCWSSGRASLSSFVLSSEVRQWKTNETPASSHEGYGGSHDATPLRLPRCSPPCQVGNQRRHRLVAVFGLLGDHLAGRRRPATAARRDMPSSATAPDVRGGRRAAPSPCRRRRPAAR